MVVISTFVIFDIETTGLPRYERNRTKITELTFLAVDMRDINTATTGHMPLINKLSYLFNPKRSIPKEVSDLTGLTNVGLQNQPEFKNRIQSLISFLEELPKPVCLVAHNGNSFDFKLLRSEFNNASANLPQDLLCVDSLWGFKRIMKDLKPIHKPMQADNSVVLISDDEDWPELNTTPEDWDEIDRLVKRVTISPKENDAKVLPVQKKLNNNHQATADKTAAIKNVFSKKPETEKTCYTLQALYKRLLNKEAINAHRSEADCIMLLECIVALKDPFLLYANENCKLISAVKPFEPY